MLDSHTIDLTLIELARTIKALKALRAARKIEPLCPYEICDTCFSPSLPAEHGVTGCAYCGGSDFTLVRQPSPLHAAAKRASMDLTRMLSKLRAGK